MTVNELIDKIALAFKEEIEEGGYVDFEDLVIMNDWQPKDIRDEIEGIATYLIDKERKELLKTYGSRENIPYNIYFYRAHVFDDCSVSDNKTELSYREFKKLILKSISKLLK